MTTTTVKTVKCVVWDLDNTVWDGVLLEDGDVTLRPAVVEVIRTLDERGILHSIASRNDHDAAMAKLTEFGIADYFLHPQIHWGNKSDSIRAVAEAINIGIDTLAFVDDQPFERDEVGFAHAQVLCIDALDAAAIPGLPEMRPRFVTADSRERRHLYRADIRRKHAEDAHQGTDEDFLASLGMRFTIAPAQERDLQRAEELTVRTNQLNATGYTYSYEELDAFRRSPGRPARGRTGGHLRHLRQDRPRPRRTRRRHLDREAAADVLPRHVARRRLRPAQPPDPQRPRRGRQTARRVRAHQPQPDHVRHLQVLRLPRGRQER